VLQSVAKPEKRGGDNGCEHGANSPFPADRSFIKLYKSDPCFSLFQKKEIGRLILLKK
jgi:hypothetical protein